jgi:hypothetical protein
MLRRKPKLLLASTPKKYIGREAAIIAIKDVARENFMLRTKNGHAYFTFLAASSQVLCGKTRTGIETSRLVQEVCSELAMKGDHTGTPVVFAKPVYLSVDFLNGAKYDKKFDVDNADASVALGGRLMHAFYEQNSFTAVKYDQALKHIIETVLSEAGANASMVVPVVIHFDEHGRFVQALNECKQANRDGKAFFEDMLRCVGSAATSYDNALSSLKENGNFFLVAITTGTSHKDARFSLAMAYGVKIVPLPLLSLSNTRKLARSFLKAYKVNKDILRNAAFQIALCDCGGIPGLVELLCQNVAGAKDSFVRSFHHQVKERVPLAADLSCCWQSLTSIYFARAKNKFGCLHL